MVFTVCCTLMGASSFGNEFNYQTMPLLLSQPVSRRKIWFEKMLVLGLAIALGLGALLICIHFFAGKKSISDDPLALVLLLAFIPLCIFCTTPYWALVGKNTLMAAVFSFISPMAIWLVLSLLGWLFSLGDLFEKHTYAYVAILIVVYCAVCYWLGYVGFMRFQTVDSQAREISLPAGLEAALARPVNKVIPGFTGPFASLIRKELQLQRASYLIAGVFCVASAFEGLVWELHHSEATMALMVLNVALCVLIIPGITAGVSVAEERNLGVTGWQLALPPSALKQWTAKSLTVLVTSVLLGIVLPATLVAVGRWVFYHELIHFQAPASWGMLSLNALDCTLVYLLFLGLVVFTSSISTNSFRAILLAFGLLAAAGCLIGLVAYAVAHVMAYLNESGSVHYPLLISQLRDWSTEHHISGDDLARLTVIVLGPAVALPAGLAHFLAFSNYRNGELNSRRCWIHASVILIAITGSAFFLSTLEFLFWASLGRF